MRWTLAKSILPDNNPRNLWTNRGKWFHTKTSEMARIVAGYTSLPRQFLGIHEGPYIRTHWQTFKDDCRSITTFSPKDIPFNVPLGKVLNDSILEDALKHGRGDWDVTWNRYTSILLIAALFRSGYLKLPVFMQPVSE